MAYHRYENGFEMRSYDKAGDLFLLGMIKAHEESKIKTNKWVEDLMQAGVKAAHPDDGWVDREENSVHFCYPYFDLDPNPGDLIALGWPDNYRLVRCTGIKSIIPIIGGIDGTRWRYYFEPIQKPKKTLIGKLKSLFLQQFS